MKKIIVISVLVGFLFFRNSMIFSNSNDVSILKGGNIACGFLINEEGFLWPIYFASVDILVTKYTLNLKYLRSIWFDYFSQYSVSYTVYSFKKGKWVSVYNVGLNLSNENTGDQRISYVAFPIDMKSKLNISENIQISNGIFINSNLKKFTIGFDLGLEFKF